MLVQGGVGAVARVWKELPIGVFRGTFVTPTKRVSCAVPAGKKIDGGQIFCVSRAVPASWGKMICFTALLPHLVVVSSGSGAMSSFCRGGPWTLVVAPAPDVLGGFHGALGATLVFGELRLEGLRRGSYCCAAALTNPSGQQGPAVRWNWGTFRFAKHV